MTREIYFVNALIVQSNGAFAVLSGFPKTFDSKNYDNDLEKTLSRARGEWNEVLGSMGKRDDRPLQEAYVIRMSDGTQIYKDSFGKMPDEPDQESEPIEE